MISDAHYSDLRPEFLYFLRDINSNRLKPTQLILMGDIFDALFGEVPYTHETNKEAIELLNAISSEIEVIYLEGNHDFNLKKVFPNINIYPLSMQPVSAIYNEKKVMLAHGDFEIGLLYRVYSTVIRNTFVLSILRLIDSLFWNFILKRLDKYLSKKDDCREFVNFKEFIYNRLGKLYKTEYFIEGHYHQNKSMFFEEFTYINLGAFACNQRFFIVKSNKDLELLEENIFSKGI